MAGHSKWAKIKHKKAVTDAKKSKIFSKIVRYISVEAKRAKGDRSAPGLRLAIEKARGANVPSDTIDRAIEKAGGSADMERVVYETYGPGGVAVVIEGLTDNRNRTGAEIKHILSLHGTSLASQGAALWAFARSEHGLSPTSTVDIAEEDGEKLAALIEQLEEHDDVQEVYTNAS